MASSRSAAAGLSTADLERIRDTLATGRRPKVVFTESAGQIAGQTGQVVQLTDPELSDEWLVVRFGHDELPFSPADLALPARNGNGRRASATPPSPPKPRKETTVPAATAAATTTTTTTTDPAAGSPRSKPAPAAKAAPDAPAGKGGQTGKGGQARQGGRAARAGRGAKSKTPPAMTVTVAYQDGEWTVAAHQGSKVLAKPYLVKPAEALSLVGMLDVPGVKEAVEQLVAAERAEAEQRAEQLRAQLAEVEAHLAELREVR
jgi:hypothetical protein